MKKRKAKRSPRKALTVAAPTSNLPAHPVSDAQAFIAMIERASRDPSVDVNKLKELLAIRNEEQTRIARQDFAVAMVRCQNGMLPVRKNMQADRFKYASLEQLDAALRDTYTREGFGISYDSQPLPDGRMLIVADVLHRGGFERRYSVPMTVSTTGPKGNAVMTQTQGEGAAVSFGRRYLLLMIFNIITSEDDNAVNPAAATKISDAQLYELNELADKGGANLKAFCAYIGVDQLINLPVSKFAEAKAALQSKVDQMAKAPTT